MTATEASNDPSSRTRSEAGRQLPHLRLAAIGGQHRSLASALERLLANQPLELLRDRGVLLEEFACILTTLAEPRVPVREERAGLLRQAQLDCQVEDGAFLGDALVVQDVEFGHPERRSHLVLHYLDFYPAAHHLGPLLDGIDASHVEPDGGVELQGAATRRGFRVAEH